MPFVDGFLRVPPQTGKVVDIGDLGVLRDPDEVFHPPAPTTAW